MPTTGTVGAGTQAFWPCSLSSATCLLLRPQCSGVTSSESDPVFPRCARKTLDLLICLFSQYLLRTYEVPGPDLSEETGEAVPATVGFPL